MQTEQNTHYEDTAQHITVFTEHLQILTRYAVRLDTGTATDNDFLEFQRFHPRITKAYQDGRYQHREYTALNNIYYHLHEDFRIYFNLNRPAGDNAGPDHVEKSGPAK